MTMRPPSRAAAQRREAVYSAILAAKGAGISSSQIAAATGVPRHQIPYAQEVLIKAKAIVCVASSSPALWYAIKHAPALAKAKGNTEMKQDDAADVWANTPPLHRIRQANDWRRDPIRPTGPASIWAHAQAMTCAAS